MWLSLFLRSYYDGKKYGKSFFHFLLFFPSRKIKLGGRKMCLAIHFLSMCYLFLCEKEGKKEREGKKEKRERKRVNEEEKEIEEKMKGFTKPC